MGSRELGFDGKTIAGVEFYYSKSLGYWRVKIPLASTIQKDFELVRFVSGKNTTGMEQVEFEKYVEICQIFILLSDPYKRQRRIENDCNGTIYQYTN